ncbi:MAG TPA: methyltransferase domain-containing protein [Thermoanaerobaculia bacterium]|nr:methyltransferase domain-containing protein [Thermoanaerobaculia bacterium]
MSDNNEAIPAPTVMPVDREVWAREIHLVNFVNAYYQYRDVQSCGPGVKRLLIVGPGQGLDTAVFKWMGYEDVNFYLDETFHPDVIGSVHELNMFRDGEFDAVIASHVLEHLAVPYLDKSLAELARVARYSIVYLPVHGRHAQLRVMPGVRGLNLSFVVDIFNYFHKPDGVTPRYMQGQHFWEIGMRGFRMKDVRARLEKQFEILNVYRNPEWAMSQNYVLKSRRHS